MIILVYRLCFQPIFCGELTRKKTIYYNNLTTNSLPNDHSCLSSWLSTHFFWEKLMTRKKPSYYNNYPTNRLPNDHSCLSSLLSAHFLWGIDA